MFSRHHDQPLPFYNKRVAQPDTSPAKIKTVPPSELSPLMCFCDSQCPRCQPQSDSNPYLLSQLDAGQALPNPDRRMLEEDFQSDLSNVRVHQGATANRLSHSVQAQAFTLGNHVVLKDDGMLQASNPVLRHEITHVLQQQDPATAQAYQNQPQPFEDQARQAMQPGGARMDGFSKSGSQPPVPVLQRLPETETLTQSFQIDYIVAAEMNAEFFKSHLIEEFSVLQNGLMQSWADLWEAEQFNAFADTVAHYQWMKGLPPTGYLDDGTYLTLLDFPQTVASLLEPDESVAERMGLRPYSVCDDATEYRLRYASELKAEELVPKGKSFKMFHNILENSFENMASIPDEYLGMGAPGAMVYTGKYEYVDPEEIWKGALKPGAVLQTWQKRSDFEKLQHREAASKEDLEAFGHSMVFLRYLDDQYSDLQILQYGSSGFTKRSKNDVWIAANPKEPGKEAGDIGQKPVSPEWE